MASRQALTFMLSLILLLVTISLPKYFSIRIADDNKSNNSIHGHGSALIEKICKNTDYYDICVPSFKSDLKSFKADVSGLLRISIDLANLNAAGILNYIDNLIKTSKDVSPSVKWCREDYRSSMVDRNKAIEALSRRDYSSVNMFVGSAHSYIVDCKLEFTMAIGLEELPPELTQMNEIMLTLDHISLQILCRNLMTCNGPFPPPPPASPTPSL